MKALYKLVAANRKKSMPAAVKGVASIQDDQSQGFSAYPLGASK